MPHKHNKDQKVVEGHHTDKKLKNQSLDDTIENYYDAQQTAIRSLLRTAPVSVDEKLATVKAAQYVDKDRFQNAFRSLMTSSNS